ncbi:NAD(P)H-binding protein [Demequina activiva]|uniref:NAD(P)-dependent oxidoreductase n=1 Tax=Demequina activiva TaxID=1582364 RepID=A0A919Q3N3_9MICO|nr:NAD(P)H-binding protein [Demequina activiva]GIG54306.1 NAD(P)-dependent oxidoreductase [Demequina activiva]
MTIAITAASGNLGPLVIDALLERGVRPSQIVAVVRDPSKLDHIAAAGVSIRQGNYDNPPSLRTAFEGAHKVLVISGSEFGRRIAQHGNAIDAAVAAGAQLIAYTSVLRASDATVNPVLPEHQGTERLLEQAGVPWVMLRNGFYTENYVEQARQAFATGEVLTSAGMGRTASATRADFAAAAAEVLVSPGHEGQRYELAGDDAWTMHDFADAVGRIAGRPVHLRQVDAAEHLEALIGNGVPQPWAEMTVAIDQAVRAGELDAPGDDLPRLIGRRTTPLEDGLRAALA